jgi:Bacterial SH3 domain
MWKPLLFATKSTCRIACKVADGCGSAICVRSTMSTALAALVVLGAMLTIVEQAQATGFCNIKRTPDGFVALRDRPTPKGKLLGRMKSGDEVLIGLGEKGNWIEVTWWKGQDRFEKGYHHTSGHGWVNSRLIEEEC